MDDIENENYLGGQLYINEQRQRYLEQHPHLEEEGDDIIRKLAHEFYTLSKEDQSEYTVRAKLIRNQMAEKEKNNGNDANRTMGEGSTTTGSSEKNSVNGIALIRDDIKDHLTCSICLDVLKKTAVVTGCLHRFCKECIESALHKCNNECPECRVHIAATRSLRYDHTFDEIIYQVMGNLNADYFENDKDQNQSGERLENNVNGRQQPSSADDVSALQVSLTSYFQCILCNELMTNVTTSPDCLHKFCEKCIHSRIEINSSCPYCETNIQKRALRRDIKYDKIQEVIFHDPKTVETSVAENISFQNSTDDSSAILRKESEKLTGVFGQGFIDGVRNRKAPEKFAPLLSTTSLSMSRKRRLDGYGNNGASSRVSKVLKTAGAPSHILFSKQEVKKHQSEHRDQHGRKVNQTDVQSIWNVRIEALKAFKQKHGDRPLPDGPLRFWSSQVRRDLSRINEDDPDSYPRGITPERIRKLVDAGFPFIPPQIFSKRLKSLTDFKHRFKHCNVSEDYADDPDLAEWCKKVRASYNCNDKSKLASHRLMTSQIAELEKLGFDFSGGKIPRRNSSNRTTTNDGSNSNNNSSEDDTSLWNEHIEALKAFKQKHGDDPLPGGVLRRWSSQVRRDLSRINEDDPDSYPRGITPERIRELVDAGFPFIPPQIFSKRLKSLTEFKHRFKHCIVSEDYADDPDLAEWCKKVRASYNCNDKSKLASHRLMTSQIAELEKLGFDFSGGKIPRRNRNILNSRSDKDDAIRQDVGFSTKTWCSQVRQEVQMIAASINEAFKENEKASSQPSASEEDLRLKIRMLSEENKSLQAKVHKYLKEKESIELTEKTVNSQLDSLNNENSTLKKQIQDLVEEKNSLCQNGKKYERKNQFLLATLKQLQEDKMLLKNQYEEKITKLSEKYQEEKQATELKLQKEKMICSKQQKLIQRLRAYMLSLRKDDDHDQNTMSPNRVN